MLSRCQDKMSLPQWSELHQGSTLQLKLSQMQQKKCARIIYNLFPIADKWESFVCIHIQFCQIPSCAYLCWMPMKTDSYVLVVCNESFEITDSTVWIRFSESFRAVTGFTSGSLTELPDIFHVQFKMNQESLVGSCTWVEYLFIGLFLINQIWSCAYQC